MSHVLIIGAGPAGLMAAETIAQAGHSVTVADAMPSVGRKFLMAGKSGLNITKAEDIETFCATYSDSAPLTPMLEAFGPEQVCDWADGLDQEIFTGSTMRVFPTAMKASPLLRAWMGRLDGLGVTLRTKTRWSGFVDGVAQFDTPEGPQQIAADATVLALGGSSWSRLGSDGAWQKTLADLGVETAPFLPSNVGFHVEWSDHMTPHFGAPIKNVAMNVGDDWIMGEFIISHRGIEGSLVYTAAASMRAAPQLIVDLVPDKSTAEVKARLGKHPKQSLSNQLRKLSLDPAKRALVMEFGRGQGGTIIKNLPIKVTGTRPLDEAISTAGGVAWDALNDAMELKALPGVFCAGEMLAWDAPTGGYLISACLASGRWAGQSVLKKLS